MARNLNGERSLVKLRKRAKEDIEAARAVPAEQDEQEEGFEVTTGAKTAKSEDRESWTKQ